MNIINIFRKFNVNYEQRCFFMEGNFQCYTCGISFEIYIIIDKFYNEFKSYGFFEINFYCFI